MRKRLERVILPETIKVYDIDGNINTIKYRFSYKDDEQRDWVEMREFTYLPGKPETGWSEGDVTYREITYFQ